MTEVIPYCMNHPNTNRVGSIGLASVGMALRLVDEQGQDVLPELPKGLTGKIHRKTLKDWALQLSA